MHHNASPCNISSTHAGSTGRSVGLSERQKAALGLMIGGASDIEVAESLKIDRSTAFRWRTENPTFRQTLDEMRQKSYVSAADQLSALLGVALDTLGKQVREVYEPVSHRAARTVLYLSKIGQYLSEQAQSNRRTPGSSGS